MGMTEWETLGMTEWDRVGNGGVVGDVEALGLL